jgi:ankyrin repeat protein
MKTFLKIIIATCMILSTGCGEGVTPLMLAARSGDDARLAVLISEGAKLDKKSRYGWTALIFASWKGHQHAVRKLLNAGADPNIVSDEVPSAFETTAGHPPTTALAEAIRNEHIDISYLLMSKGAKLGRLSVALAGAIGNTELLAYMKDQGVDFNKYSNNEFNPSALCSSVASGNLQTVRWLCDNGAKINIILGHSLPLKIAVRNQHPDIVKYLLEHSADPNMNAGDPAYHHSYPLGEAVMQSPSNLTSSNNTLRIINLLLKYGADISIIDNGGQTILEQKLIQRENGRKYEAKYLSEDKDPEVLKRFRISNKHDDAVIELLKKFKANHPLAR